MLTATCTAIKEHGRRIVRLEYTRNLYENLEKLSEIPLPQYIKEQLLEKDRYQTVYATEEGSAAAPTAGLHFTKELLDEIKAIGVTIVYITLHVGLGTFRPVNVDNVNEHKMHAEFYQMSKDRKSVLTKTKEKI